MEQSDKMKLKFAQSIKELMSKRPLDKITVGEIVSLSNVTRQTFYRHFKDKYDLVNWYFEQLVEESFLQMGKALTLQEALTQKFMFIRKERVFFTEAFRCDDTNSLVAYDFHYIYDFYSNIIEKNTSKTPDDETLFLLELYCSGSIHMTVKWVAGAMKMPEETVARLLVDAMPERLRKDLSVIG